MNDEKTTFSEEEVASGMLETVLSERAITVDGYGDLILKYPNKEDEYEADLERSRHYTRLLLDGLKTEDEMKVIAEERGLWTSEEEARLDEIQTKIIDLRLKLRDEKSGNKKRKLQKDILDLRNESTQLTIKKQKVFGHTIESKMQQIWWQFLTFRCTFRKNEDGELERVWKSWKEFLQDSNNSFQVVSEFIVFYHGLTDNFFGSLLGEETEPPESGESDGE